MPPSRTNLQRLAFILVLLSKVFGIAGLALGMFHRFGGGLLLAFDGVLIVSAVAVSLWAGREQKKQDEDDRSIVARLLAEGTLQHYVSEVSTRKSARTSQPALPRMA